MDFFYGINGMKTQDIQVFDYYMKMRRRKKKEWREKKKNEMKLKIRNDLSSLVCRNLIFWFCRGHYIYISNQAKDEQEEEAQEISKTRKKSFIRWKRNDLMWREKMIWTWWTRTRKRKINSKLH